jgi:hypothetical protein
MIVKKEKQRTVVDALLLFSHPLIGVESENDFQK